MGRGKGNVDSWVCIIKPGRILFEVKSIDPASVKEALFFTIRKLPIKAHVISRDLLL
jgi:large subunit ribosomal protein L16